MDREKNRRTLFLFFEPKQNMSVEKSMKNYVIQFVPAIS